MIRTSTETADAEGQPVSAFSDLVTIWAHAEFLSGRELEAMQKINSEIALRFTVSRRRDVTPKMQVRWKSPVSAMDETYNIQAILPTEDKFDMALLCSKVE